MDLLKLSSNENECKPLTAGGLAAASHTLANDGLWHRVAACLRVNAAVEGQETLLELTVGRCRLLLSKPMLKAPKVSALEANIR
jgi:hypothetical protein